MSRVFISYVREDEDAAERLYNDLKKHGAEPWLDKYDLMPGQGWRGAIKQAVRRSSHFIAVISCHSIRKRGHAQVEIREALEMLKEIPPDEIYLIPVRLDTTTSPYQELQGLHYVNLFPEYAKGLQQLFKALEVSGGIDTRKRRAPGATTGDAERVRAYRGLFDRPAFRLPCIFEFAIVEVEAAIQDISAAMASGLVYSRDGRMLMEVPPISAFQDASYVSALERLRNSLTPLRQAVNSLLNALCKAAGLKRNAFRREFHHMEFFLEALSRKGVDTKSVMEAINLMDQVDALRNAILKQLNALLQQGHSRVLPYITLSTAQLKLSSELEENKGEGSQRWGDYYLRTHRELRAFLDGLD